MRRGMSAIVAAAALMGLDVGPILPRAPKDVEPKRLTSADYERLEAARQKRERRAEKRRKT